MSHDQAFGVFRDDEAGPQWRAFFASFELAKSKAQEFANGEGCEFFIYNYENSSEVARLFHSRRKPHA